MCFCVYVGTTFPLYYALIQLFWKTKKKNPKNFLSVFINASAIIMDTVMQAANERCTPTTSYFTFSDCPEEKINLEWWQERQEFSLDHGRLCVPLSLWQCWWSENCQESCRICLPTFISGDFHKCLKNKHGVVVKSRVLLGSSAFVDS